MSAVKNQSAAAIRAPCRSPPPPVSPVAMFPRQTSIEIEIADSSTMVADSTAAGRQPKMFVIAAENRAREEYRTR